MSATPDPLKISIAREKSSSGINYFNIIHTPDLPDGLLKYKKDLALTIPLEVLMPIHWDFSDVKTQETKAPDKYLGIREYRNKLDSDSKKRSAEAARKKYQQDLIPLGNDTQTDLQVSVTRSLMQAMERSRIDPSDMRTRTSTDPVRINPLKLLIAAYNYETISLGEPQYRDYFDIIFDKIALSAFLAFFLEDVWKTLNIGDAADPIPPAQFDQHFLNALEAAHPLSAPTERLLLQPPTINLVPESWESILRHCLVPSLDEPDSLVLSLDDLDQILTEHLRKLFEELRSEVPSAEWDKINSWREDEQGEWSKRRGDYAMFYPVIDKFFSERVGQRLFKIRFLADNALPEMPFIEEIDVRPAVWAREATLITTEMYVAATRYTYLKKRFDAAASAKESTDSKASELEALAEGLRRATKLWFESKRQLELLEDEVAAEGYQLTLHDEKAGPGGISLGQFYKLTQKVSKVKHVRVKKSRVEAYTVQERHTRCSDVRIGFSVFKIRIKRRCRDFYRPRTKHRTVDYYITEARSYVVDEEVKVDYDPIQDYLDLSISSDAFGLADGDDDAGRRDARAKAFAESVGKKEFDPTAALANVKNRMVYTGLENRDKRIHVFSVTLGEYVDQNGMTLESVLKEIENDQPFYAEELHERFKRILFVPIVERRLNGEVQTMKYLVIHNPVLGRNSMLAPVVHLKETYRQGIHQMSGHWLGALSHTVCLFPGEARRVKLVTESKFVTEQKREQRSTQSSSMKRSINVVDKVSNELAQRESQKKSFNWHAKVSGSASYGAYKISAEAGAGGENSSSAESVARTLNERTSEVMNEVSSSNEVQFLTATDVKESHSTVSEQLVEFTNVNQGRAVNYKFFQIMHGFESTVSLHDVKIIIEYADELIPGANIQKTEEYSLDEIDAVLPELVEEERQALIAFLKDEIEKRYKPKKVKLANGDLSDEVFLAKDEDGRVVGIKPVNRLAQDLGYVNSGAVFVDTEVGHLPATEDYVEDARRVELAAQEASVKRVEAEAEALQKGVTVIPGGVGNLTVHLSQPEDASGDGPDNA